MYGRLTIPLLTLATFLTSSVYAFDVDTISVEVTPSVIRTDGSESAYIEVKMHEPVKRVYLQQLFSSFKSPATQSDYYDLHDDGLNGDKVAGDLIFTGGPFEYNTDLGQPAFFYYGNDTLNSPAGIKATALASFIKYEKQSGETERLLHSPYIGLLDASIPVPDSKQMSESILATPNLININTTEKHTQVQLRSISNAPTLVNATKALYQRFPDQFDFLAYMPADLLERAPYLSGPNFNKGIFLPAQVDFTGSALNVRDDTTQFGSKGRLKGFLAMDNLGRGIESENFLHELMHYWLVKFDPNFGINIGSHYSGLASVSGVHYGFPWIDNGNGTFTLDCTLPRQHTQANTLEKYIMGFIAPEQVEPVYVIQNNDNAIYECGQVIQGDIKTVTIDDIQAKHGPRLPGIAESQKVFNIAFVVESHNRFLTPTELAFYHLLATHATEVLADDAPTPALTQINWGNINKYFGPGVLFHSDIPYQVPAAPANLTARSKSYHVNVLWNEVADAQNYLVYRQVAGETAFSLIDEVQNPIYIGDIPLGAASASYYVVAKNEYGLGPDSSTIVATPTLRQRSR